METETTKYFNDIIDEAKNVFSNLDYTIDNTPERAILRINAIYKDYRIFVTELLSDDYRKYNFYLLKDDYVIIGFDNAQDIRAIKLKFEKIPNSNIDRLVPHKHLKNKTILKLTDEISITDFINWIKLNIH